jgi:hypothetical protein
MELKAAHGEEIGGTVPANIVNCVELIGDFGDCCHDDGLVDGDEENGEGHGDAHNDELFSVQWYLNGCCCVWGP